MSQVLMADIGGTYIRFWALKQGQVKNLKIFLQSTKTPIETAIQECLKTTNLKPDCFVAGAAGKLRSNGIIHLTNRDVTIDMPRICKKFNFKKALLANDMVFHTTSILDQPDTQNACIVVLGTGFGCAYIKDGIIVASEDGHNKIAHSNKELKNLSIVTWENALSGPAFLNIYQKISDTHKPVAHSREVSYLANNSTDETAIHTYKIMVETLAQFCIETASKKSIPVFYFGGLAVELMRSKEAQELFFKALGKYADVLSIRLIKLSDQSAMKGLNIIANDLLKSGTTKRVNPEDFYTYSA